MTKGANHARDGAEPVPWGDYAVHLVLLVSTATLAALRIVGLVHWSWWLVLLPLWLLLAVIAASVVAAVMHPDR